MLGIDLEKADHGLGTDLRLIASDVGRALSQLVLRTDVSGMPLEWIDEDELVEVTPQSVRIRKAVLDATERKRIERRLAAL